MDKVLEEKLQAFRDILKEAEIYAHATRLISFDQETICPAKGMEDEGEVSAFLGNQAFKLMKAPEFIENAEYLYEHRDELSEPDRVCVESQHRSYAKTKNISPEKNMEYSLIYNKAFVDWTGARQNSDFSMFRDSLQKVKEINVEMVELRDEKPASGIIYDALLDDYEIGITSKILDECFDECKERLIPLLKKIMESPKKIRTDFLHIEVTEEQQRRMTEALLGILNFDRSRSAYSTSEHPFTNWIGKNDTRITTHYYPLDFSASMYSIIHEGGHALFEMLQPEDDYEHFINDNKTLGMHESVSRFYENRLGRSRAFVKLIYPKVCEIFPNVMEGVSEEELYEALNVVCPSLIRTESDEFTYTFHIIIRYEIEKEIFEGKLSIDDVPRRWKEKYEEYLGISPETDREGVLQDVHWTFGFGYFPTYALGNMYNAMYYNRMKNEIDIDGCVEKGDFATINNWMKENVFVKANHLAPSEWIKDITGRDFTADDFLNYIEEKFKGIYEI